MENKCSKKAILILFLRLPIGHCYLALVRNDEYKSTYTQTLKTRKQRCLYVDELFNSSILTVPRMERIEYYHLPCENYDKLWFFYDEIYMCLYTRVIVIRTVLTSIVKSHVRQVPCASAPIVISVRDVNSTRLRTFSINIWWAQITTKWLQNIFICVISDYNVSNDILLNKISIRSFFSQMNFIRNRLNISWNHRFT